jgi:hypothetical protein
MQPRKLLFTFFVITFAYLPTFSQQQAYFGFGAGFDYGGLGVKAEFLPIKNLGLFGGLGYNFDGPSYNAGLSFKVLPGKRVTPTIMAMYGYNAVIRIKPLYSSAIAKTYYGPSFGAGVDIFGKRQRNKFSMALIVPVRSSSFKDDYDTHKRNGVTFNPDIMPVAFSFGYNIRLNPSK